MKKSAQIAATLAIVLVAGCAGKQQVKDTGKPQPTPAPTAAAADKGKSYLVKKGDNLWKISSRPEVFGDAFRWPLLYKQNRDQITDPDLIEARQDLNYRKDYSKAEIKDAVQKAKETPPFVPHQAPRKSLPVKY